MLCCVKVPLRLVRLLLSNIAWVEDGGIEGITRAIKLLEKFGRLTDSDVPGHVLSHLCRFEHR